MTELPQYLQMLARQSMDPDYRQVSGHSPAFCSGITYGLNQAATIAAEYATRTTQLTPNGLTLASGELSIVRVSPDTWRVYLRSQRGQRALGDLPFRRGEAIESLEQRALDLYWDARTEVTGVVA